MNLYQVDNAIFKLYAKFTDAETGEVCDYKDPETEEVTSSDEFFNELERLNMKREDIIENMGLMIKNNTADIKALDDEIKALKKRKDALEKQTNRIKQNAADALHGEGLKTAKVVLFWCPSTTTEVDETVCPKEYMRVKTTTEPDKTAIKAALKAGEKIDGCKLVKHMHLNVR